MFVIFNDIEKIPYQIEIPEESSLEMIVEGRKPNCYVCRTYMKTQCPPYKPSQSERPVEKDKEAETEVLKNTENMEYVGDRDKGETKKNRSERRSEKSNVYVSPKMRKKATAKKGKAEEFKQIPKKSKKAFLF